MPSVGSPGGIAPPGSHGTVREPLDSHRSYHLIHSNVPVHCHCTKSPRLRATRSSHHRLITASASPTSTARPPPTTSSSASASPNWKTTSPPPHQPAPHDPRRKPGR